MEIIRVKLAERVFLTGFLLQNSKEYRYNQPRPAVIVSPGGGFQMHSQREMEPVALKFSTLGYQAFVLEYSIGPEHHHPDAMLDLARAVAAVRGHAGEWRVDPNSVVTCGFSAGAFVTGSLGNHWNAPLVLEALGVEPEQVRPNAQMLCYPLAGAGLQWDNDTGRGVDFSIRAGLLGDPGATMEDCHRIALHKQVNRHTPPTFLWHTAGDTLIHVRNSLAVAQALADQGVPFELHVFERGPHALSLATPEIAGRREEADANCAEWFGLAANWLRLRFLKQ